MGKGARRASDAFKLALVETRTSLAWKEKSTPETVWPLLQSNDNDNNNLVRSRRQTVAFEMLERRVDWPFEREQDQ